MDLRKVHGVRVGCDIKQRWSKVNTGGNCKNGFCFSVALCQSGLHEYLHILLK